MATAHVVPVSDQVAHIETDDCVCGPWVEPVEDDTGRTVGFVAVHASLDGREHREQPAEWAVADERIGENA